MDYRWSHLRLTAWFGLGRSLESLHHFVIGLDRDPCSTGDERELLLAQTLNQCLVFVIARFGGSLRQVAAYHGAAPAASGGRKCGKDVRDGVFGGVPGCTRVAIKVWDDFA